MKTKVVSNIKSKSFYKKANALQEGWGDYLKHIDELKDKKANNQPFTLKEFCWALYGDGHCWSTWDGFKRFSKGKKPRRYTAWTELFESYLTLNT